MKPPYHKFMNRVFLFAIWGRLLGVSFVPLRFTEFHSESKTRRKTSRKSRITSVHCTTYTLALIRRKMCFWVSLVQVLFILFQEKTAVLDSLKQRATLVKQAYGSIEGIRCNEVQGAMYAFPQIQLPQKAIDKARVSFARIFFLCVSVSFAS